MRGGSSEDVALVGVTTFDKKKFFFLVWLLRLRQENGWEFETSLAIQ